MGVVSSLTILVEFHAVQSMRVSTFWKQNDVLSKGCCEVSGFHLFRFCSKPRGPIPSISVPIRSTPWAQCLTQKVILKAVFSYLHGTCGWLLLQRDTCWAMILKMLGVKLLFSDPKLPLALPSLSAEKIVWGVSQASSIHRLQLCTLSLLLNKSLCLMPFQWMAAASLVRWKLIRNADSFESTAFKFCYKFPKH